MRRCCLGGTSAITPFAPRGRIGPVIRADVGIKSTHRMIPSAQLRCVGSRHRALVGPMYQCPFSRGAVSWPSLGRYISFRCRLVGIWPPLARYIFLGSFDEPSWGHHRPDIFVSVRSTSRPRATTRPINVFLRSGRAFDVESSFPRPKARSPGLEIVIISVVVLRFVPTPRLDRRQNALK